jgi:hypothetical protein
VYGLAVCVYQWGAFDGLHLRALGQVRLAFLPSLPPSLPPWLCVCTSGAPLMAFTYVRLARYVLPPSLPPSLPRWVCVSGLLSSHPRLGH